MANPVDNPLDKDHCKCLDDVLEAAARVRTLIQKCKNCGLDMTEFDSDNESHAEMARKAKSEFFPNRQ